MTNPTRTRRRFAAQQRPGAIDLCLQEGRWIYYGLEPSALLLLRDWLDQLAAGCQSPAPPCS
jgi:hypothetical protein